MKSNLSYSFLLIFFLCSVTISAQSQKESLDYVQSSVRFLDKLLTLDDSQKAAITTVITDNRNKIMAITEQEGMRAEEKTEKRRLLSDKMDEEIVPVLSKSQAKKYLLIKSERDKK